MKHVWLQSMGGKCVINASQCTPYFACVRAGGPCLISDARLSYPALVAGDLNAGMHMIGWSAAGLTDGRAADFAQRYNIPIQVIMMFWICHIGLRTVLYLLMPAALTFGNVGVCLA